MGRILGHLGSVLEHFGGLLGRLGHDFSCLGNVLGTKNGPMLARKFLAIASGHCQHCGPLEAITNHFCGYCQPLPTLSGHCRTFLAGFAIHCQPFVSNCQPVRAIAIELTLGLQVPYVYQVSTDWEGYPCRFATHGYQVSKGSERKPCDLAFSCSVAPSFAQSCVSS